MVADTPKANYITDTETTQRKFWVASPPDAKRLFFLPNAPEDWI